MKKKWKLIVGVFTIIFGATFYFVVSSSTKLDTKPYTEIVKKTTLISSISTSGNITNSNTTNISTKASGTVKKVYVNNGDLVKKGQKILEITLDSDGVERKSSAWIAYLTAKEEIESAEKSKQDLSIQVWRSKQAILDSESEWEKYSSDTSLTDAERHQKEEAVAAAKLAFEEVAVKLENAEAKIAAKKISAQEAYLDYQDLSGMIIAPADGVINNLTLTAGSTLVAATNQSTTTGSSYASSQTIGFIRSANNQYQAEVSLTESDVVNVKAGQKVNISLDAYSDKSFTGKVLAVDISGSSNSGVTSYPATILIDQTELALYPNMTVSVVIITNIEEDVLTVPTSAITTTNGESMVQLIKDGSNTTVYVTLGSSNNTETVITSGLSEGDEVVVASTTSAKNDNKTSAFGTSRTTTGSDRSGNPAMMGVPGL